MPASAPPPSAAGAGWRLDGGKLWIHNAPVCDFAVVLARTDKEAGRRGMSIFLVDRDRPGFSVGKREHKMGQRASPVGALHFEGVELPAEALLGEEGRGFHMMMSVLDKGRVGIAALAVGIAQAGLEAAVGYARERRQFGKADRPSSRGCSGCWPTWPRTSRRHACSRWTRRSELDRGRARHHGLLDGQVLGRGRGGGAAAPNAVQVFGGSGYIKGFEVERLYRDAKICQIYEGTNQIQRTIIARELLQGGA